jgi:hypothetical protein
MSDEHRNITLTIELDPATNRYVIGGHLPNPAWGEMLADILHEEMKFRFRSALASEAQRVAVPLYVGRKPRGLE